MHKEIIAIFGMPRSGTSWLSQIIDSSPRVAFRLSPLFSYALKNMVDEYSSKDAYEEMFRRAYMSSEDEFMNQLYRRRAGQYPVFEIKEKDPDVLVIKDTRYHNLKKRMLELMDNLKIVAIVRHPCGAIHSWLTNPGEFPNNADPMKEWRTGACRKTGPEEFWGFDDWKKITSQDIQFERQFAGRYLILQYEEMVANPIEETRQMFTFLGLDYTDQTENFVIASHQTVDPDPYSVFKNPQIKNRWKGELDVRIQNEIINEIQNTELARFLK